MTEELRRRLVLPIVPSPPPTPAYLTMVSQLSNVFCKIQIIFVKLNSPSSTEPAEGKLKGRFHPGLSRTENVTFSETVSCVLFNTLSS